MLTLSSEHKTVVRGVAQNIGIDSFINDSSRVDNKGLNYQDCDVLFHVNKQRADIAEGLHVDRDDVHVGNGDLWWSCSDGETQVTDVPVVTRTAAQHRSTQQHNHHKQEQPTEQAMQEGEREQREEGEKGQEERERGERGKKEKGGKEEERDAEEEGREQVKKDVTSWTVVTRNKREKRRTIQIFVKVHESRTFPLDVSADDKVDDVIKQIQSEEDVYVTLHGRVLKRSEKLKSCAVTDGCMIQVTSRMRGGGKHKDKKSKAEKKQAASGKTLEQKFVEEVRSDVSQETHEKDEDKMIHLLEDSMSSWVEFWSKESDDEVGQKMENWMSVLQGLKEVDHERASI